jgi:hypothetical protein
MGGNTCGAAVGRDWTIAVGQDGCAAVGQAWLLDDAGEAAHPAIKSIANKIIIIVEILSCWFILFTSFRFLNQLKFGLCLVGTMQVCSQYSISKVDGLVISGQNSPKT